MSYFIFMFRRCRVLLIVLPVLICCVLQAAIKPVAFEFRIQQTTESPFAREIWAEVALPLGRVVNYPAFYTGNNHYAVRVRADIAGFYSLGKVTETSGERTLELAADVRGSRRKNVRTAESIPAIKIDPVDPRRFALSSGERFVPLGANLAWPDGSAARFYRRAFDAFSRNGLNWTRVWMSHWGGLNLDWLPQRRGLSRRGFELDLRVAESWDEIFEAAEEKGIYFQMVLQHHGQYSSEVNSNWKDNPWNVANGGFLKTPVEFFTSPEAIQLTMHKYRYIVARWGYSPALMCWELFNEVHWTDAMRGENKNEGAVARWHSLLAGYLRSLDRHGHLVTTSTEDFNSPVYADMDYFQPHLYPANLLAGARKFQAEPDRLTKPVFYGEMGDDHLPVSEEEKKSGCTIVPPVWASLMGRGYFPAQVWLGGELVEKGRLSELGAVARFLTASGLYRRTGLSSCEMVVESQDRVPLVLAGGHMWHRLPPPELSLPLDGREPIGLPDIPRIYMNRKESVEKGYPGRATYHVNLTKPLTLRFRITDSAVSASAFRFSVDGAIAAEVSWEELPKDSTAKGPRPQPDVIASVPAGEHTLVVENPADVGWFDLAEIDFGLEQSVLAAVGQRNDDFVALWLWNRRGVFANTPTAAVSGTLLIDDLPAGRWRVTWWDTQTGKHHVNPTILHNGGTLRVFTPKIARHAAVFVERSD